MKILSAVLSLAFAFGMNAQAAEETDWLALTAPPVPSLVGSWNTQCLSSPGQTNSVKVHFVFQVATFNGTAAIYGTTDCTGASSPANIQGTYTVAPGDKGLWNLDITAQGQTSYTVFQYEATKITMANPVNDPHDRPKELTSGKTIVLTKE